MARMLDMLPSNFSDDLLSVLFVPTIRKVSYLALLRGITRTISATNGRYLNRQFEFPGSLSCAIMYHSTLPSPSFPSFALASLQAVDPISSSRRIDNLKFRRIIRRNLCLPKWKDFEMFHKRNEHFPLGVNSLFYIDPNTRNNPNFKRKFILNVL